jgi:hypothetical protein
MNTKRHSLIHLTLIVALAAIITTASTHLRADTGTCSGQMITVPFTDVAGNTFFCSIAEAYFSGLTNGTSPTTYSPSQNVPRDQMAAFITRTQDSVLRRGSRRAALRQWSQGVFASSGMTTVGFRPKLVQSDGRDVWVASEDSELSRVRASDGKLLTTWVAPTDITGVLVARGHIYMTGNSTMGSGPGRLYRIDPNQPPGPVTTLAANLGTDPTGVTTDGFYIWTANFSSPGSVSKVHPGTGDVQTFSAGFNQPKGILYDGSNIWVADNGANQLKKLNSDGTVAQSITVGNRPLFPIFDGTNIWVPNYADSSVTIVRASTGAVLATLTGNGLDHPSSAAFDGQRILVTNFGNDSVSLWKATDLTPLGSFSAPSGSEPN